MFLCIRILTVILLISATYIELNVKKKNQSSIVFTFLLCCYIIQNIFDIAIYMYSAQKLSYVSQGSPINAAYSPLLYFYHKSCNSKLSVRQIIAHSIMPAFWWLLYFPFLIDKYFRELLGNVYYITLYAYIALSWFGYSFYMLSRLRDTLYNRTNIMPIAIYYLLFSIFAFIQIITDSDDEAQKELSRILVSIFILGASMILFNLALRRFKNYTLIEKNWVMFAPTLHTNKKKHSILHSGISKIHAEHENSIEDFFNSPNILKPELDIREAAKALNITQKHLSALIKQNYHTTFLKLLTTKRIEMACKFMLDESLKNEYESLYHYCGFRSKSTFYRNFLYTKGCTPSQYRARHSANN